jgi:hypothetical protein
MVFSSDDCECNHGWLKMRTKSSTLVAAVRKAETLEFKLTAIWFVGISAVLATVFWLCNRNIVFSLDDAYVHLSVGHNLTQGTYGVNITEASSPSSSIIWPYFMAATEFLRLGIAGPLLLNMLAVVVTIFYVVHLAQEVALINFRDAPIFSYILSSLLLIVISSIALPVTGMEHSWHVMLSIMTFAGLVEAAQRKQPPIIALLALAFMPLIRFEGLAFAGCAIVAYWLLGFRRVAIRSGFVIMMILICYVGLMWNLRLPAIPSSVMVKSGIAEATFTHELLPTRAVVQNLVDNLVRPEGMLLLFIGSCIALLTIQNPKESHAYSIIYIAVILSIVAHLILGRIGWFHRYEVYIMSLSVVCLAHAVGRLLPNLSNCWRLIARGFLIGVCVFASLPYLVAALKTPLASRNIYEQQFQMAEFAKRFYDQPVAVNDLGLVSYKNHNFVLDLWGLGSEKVRKLRHSGRYGPEQIAELVKEYNVGLVMIYESWFANTIPSTWKLVAILHTSKVTAAAAEVSFFLTPHGDESVVFGALYALKATIPNQDDLMIID